MQSKNLICLGAIVGVHGIKGEVKVKSFTACDRDIGSYGALTDQNGKTLHIKVVGHSKDLLRIKIEGVNDRNLAQTFIGTQLFVDRSVLPPTTDSNEFYQADLIHLKVKATGSNEIVGEVAGIYNFGAGDILEIKINSTGKLEMIPFNHAYVPTVNIEEGYIIVNAVSMQFEPDEKEDENNV